MTNAQLTFANPDIRLSVRSFSVHDGLSRLFDVWITAASEDPDLDFEAIIGGAAVFRLATTDPDEPWVAWVGLCNDIEQVSVEPDGVSIYALRIVPALWRTTQRRNHRVFQHVSAADVATALLGEWEIEHELRLRGAALPVREYRVQYGESDFAFLSRLLEDAGVWYWFEPAAPVEGEKLERTKVVLSDEPMTTCRRIDEPVPYRGHTDAHDAAPYVSRVRFARALRPGQLTIGGRDYRSSPDLKLLAEARAGAEHEQRRELYHFISGAFLVEPAGAEGEGAEAAANASAGDQAARVALERVRSRARRVSMSTNVLALAPAVIFRVEGHPRGQLCDREGLLAVERTLDGEVSLDWQARVLAVLGRDRQRPERITPRPRVMGLQSAVVVGPAGEEIHTDELGRVRVQFFWDRYGQRDERSSCWVRVSQGWAGSGYGLCCLPRVGHEVLVGFFEGDPDAPIVVGSAHHRGATAPQLFPKEKTSSTWRSHSTPGGEGFNEIRLEDAAGAERLVLRAQRNLEQVVLADALSTVGGKLARTVKGDEQRQVGGDQSIEVEGDRDVSASGHCSTQAAGGLQLQAGEGTGMSCQDGKVVISNGSASIVLDGPNVVINSAANLRLAAGALLGLCGKQLSLDGDPEVFINSAQAVPPAVAALGAPGATDAAAEPDDGAQHGVPPDWQQGSPPQSAPAADLAESEAESRYAELGTGGGAPPERVRLPRAINEQLARQAQLAGTQGVVCAPLMAPASHRDACDEVSRGLKGQAARLHELAAALRSSGSRHASGLGALGRSLATHLAAERGQGGGASRRKLLASAALLGGGAALQGRRLAAAREDVRAALEHRRATLADLPDGERGQQERLGGQLEQLHAELDDEAAGPLDADEQPAALAQALGRTDALGAGTALSRDGGLAAGDVAHAVGGPGPAFLQSPGEGQIMAVAGGGARPIDEAALSSRLVDAQMDGRPMDGAITEALQDSGYAVYRRPADDFGGEMIRAAV